MFTNDVYIDSTVLSGIEGRYSEVKWWLSEVLPNFPVYAPICSATSRSASTGDTASVGVICFNSMLLHSDKNEMLFCGLWYALIHMYR
nr:hypothetical protein [Mycobacterium lepromatosis]